MRSCTGSPRWGRQAETGSAPHLDATGAMGCEGSGIRAPRAVDRFVQGHHIPEHLMRGRQRVHAQSGGGRLTRISSSPAHDQDAGGGRQQRLSDGFHMEACCAFIQQFPSPIEAWQSGQPASSWRRWPCAPSAQAASQPWPRFPWRESVRSGCQHAPDLQFRRWR